MPTNKKTSLAGAAAGHQPAAYRSGAQGGRSASRGTRRSTVDLPTDVSKQLVVRARQDDLTNQTVLAALATAYAAGDERALAIVAEARTY